MSDFIRIVKTMRAGEWAKAKAHLEACSNTFWKEGADHREDTAYVFMDLVEEFIKNVEGGELVE